MKWIAAGPLILLFVFLTSCQGKKPAPEQTAGAPGAPRAVVTLLPPLTIQSGAEKKEEISARPLTNSGVNSEPVFSADGGKILFISRARPSHKQAQVYELDLVRMTERRLTFHDGDDASPAWWNANEFLYSSSTDKIKEEAAMVANLKSAFLGESKPAAVAPSDLYRQRTDGREIKRLTKSPGIDQNPSRDPRSQHVVFTRFEGTSRLSLLEGEHVKAISMKEENDYQPRYSPDGKHLLFIRGIDDKRSQLFISEGINLKSARPYLSDKNLIRDAAWNPSGESVIFTSNAGGKIMDLYVLDLKQDCFKRLTASSLDLHEPAFSPDGRNIVFTTQVSGAKHLYMMDYNPAAGSCLRSTD